MIQAILVFLYSVVLFVGGLVGYLKANSVVSLVVGSLSAVLVIAFAVGLVKQARWGLLGAIVLAGILGAFFTYRYLLSLHFMPGGLMALISWSLFAYLCYSWANSSERLSF